MLSFATRHIIDNKKSIFYRIIMFFISSIFLTNIPLILFLVYMGHYGFFSYDFYIDGIFGIKVFFILTSIILITFSFCFLGFIIPILNIFNKKGGLRANIALLISLILINSSFIFLIAYKMGNKSDPIGIIYLLLTSAAIMTHVCCMIYHSTKAQLGSLIILVIIVLLTTFFMRQDAVSLVSMGLKTYGTGGNISIKLDMKDKEIIYGKLILLTPENVYLKVKDNPNLSIVQRDDIHIITLEKE